MANRINVILNLDTSAFERSINKAAYQMQRFGQRLEGIGRDLTARVTLPIAAIGTAAVKSFAEFESISRSLEAVTGDAEVAAQEIERLRKVAEAPGLGFAQAVKASARLQAVGLNADDAREAIRQYGNAVARSGGGRAEFDGAILALTQIASKGKISAEEINQLNERIFEIRPALQAAFGTSNSEELQKLGVSAEEFIARTTAEFAKLERVQGGLANAFENLRDSTSASLSELGKVIVETIDLNAIIEKVTRSIQGAVTWFKNLDDSTKRTIITVAGVAAAIGPLLIGLGSLVRLLPLVLSGVRALATGFGPVGIAIGVVVPLLIDLYKNNERFRIAVKNLVGRLKEFGTRVGELGNALGELFGKLLDVKVAGTDLSTFIQNNLISVVEDLTNVVKGLTEVLSADFGKGFRDLFKNLAFLTGPGRVAKTFIDYFKKRGEESGLAFTNAFNSQIYDLEQLRDLIPGQQGILQPVFPEVTAPRTTPETPETPRTPTVETPTDDGNELTSFGQFKDAILNVRAFVDEIDNAEVLISRFGQSTKAALAPLEEIVPNRALELLDDLNDRLKLSTQEAQIFGTDALGLLQEQIWLVSQAIQEGLNLGLTNQSEIIIGLQERLAALQGQYEGLTTTAEIFESVGTSVFDSLTQSFQDGIDGAKGFAEAFVKAILNAVNALIKLLIAKAIESALKGSQFLGPAAVPIAAAAGVAASALFKSIIGKVQPFAEGGLVFGPTLALIGEGSGTSRTNPEVVAPLNQLRALLAESGVGAGQVTVQGVLRGDDIYLATVRAATRADRRGGQVLKID